MLENYTDSELLYELIKRKALVVDDVRNLQEGYVPNLALYEYKMRSVIRGTIEDNLKQLKGVNMKVYALFDKNKGYAYEDEDLIGCGYSFEIDEYTLLFRDIEIAKGNSNKNEDVVEVEIPNDFESEYLI